MDNFRAGFTLSVAMFAALLLAVAGAPAVADEFDDARETFMEAETSAAFFDDAYGYALFPRIGKGGVGIGGARGKGRVYVGGEHVGNVTMSQVSVGFQFGGQTFAQIIFFEDESAFEEFSGGNFEFGAGVSAVAINASASASTSTAGGGATAAGSESNASFAGGYTKGYAVFTVAKAGLMYEAVLAGQKFKYRPVD